MAASLYDALGWNDLLSKHNMKSWQETVRSFSVAVMTTTTLVLLYKSDQNTVSCLLLNETLASWYREPQADFANSVCSYQARWFFSNVPWLCMLATGLLFVADNYWLVVPSVGATIIKVDEICKLFLQIGDVTHLPGSCIVDHQQIRNSFRELWKLLSYFEPEEMFLCLKKRTISSTSIAINQQEDSNNRCDETNEADALISSQDPNIESSSAGAGDHVLPPTPVKQVDHETEILSQVDSKRKQALQRRNEDLGHSADLMRKAEAEGQLVKRLVFVKKYMTRNYLSTVLSIAWFIALAIGTISETWHTRVNSDCYIAQQQARYRCVFTSHDFVLPALAIFLLATVSQTVSVVMVMVRGKDLDDLELLLDMKHGTADQEKLEDLREMVRKRVWPSKMIATADLLLSHAVSSGDLDFIKFYDFISRGDLTRALTGLRFAKEEDLEVYETLIYQHLSHKPDIPTPEELKTLHRFRMRKRK